MPITQDAVAARLAQLRESVERQQANLNATLGAIQDCEHWMAALVASDTDPTVAGTPASPQKE